MVWAPLWAPLSTWAVALQPGPWVVPGRSPGQGSALRALGPLLATSVAHTGRGTLTPADRPHHLRHAAIKECWLPSRTLSPTRPRANGVVGRLVFVTWRLRCPGPYLPWWAQRQAPSASPTGKHDAPKPTHTHTHTHTHTLRAGKPVGTKRGAQRQ